MNKHTHNKCKYIWMLTEHRALMNSPHKPPFIFFFSFIEVLNMIQTIYGRIICGHFYMGGGVNEG